MAFTEKISLVVDVVTGSSRTSLNRLKTDLAGADGAMGKLKVAGAGLGQMFTANIGAAALAGGTAIAAFGAKAISDFQDTALGAGKLADSLGVTTEEASRLQEVAGDLGIGVGALESTMGKMNRTAATTPEAFEGIGAAIAKNKDGTTDVTQTFLNAIDALNKIPDATQRAAAAQKIFGRGWQDISELVGKGAEGVREALASVEQQKIINDEEVANAREFRDTLDDLKGVGESVSIAVGGELVDSFNDLKVIVEQVKGPIEDVSGLLDDIPGGEAIKSTLVGILVPMSNVVKGLDLASDAIRDYQAASEITASLAPQLAAGFKDAADAANGFESRLALTGQAAQDATIDLKDFYESTSEGKERLTNIADAQKAAADAAQEHSDALLAQAGILQEQADAARASVDAGFALRDAQRDAEAAALAVNEVMANEDATLQELAEALDKSSQAAIEVADAQVRQADEAYRAAGATLTAKDKVDIHNRSLLEQARTLEGPARQALIDHIAQLNGIDPTVATEIQTLIDQGKMDEANALLASTSRTRTATIEGEARTAAAERALNDVARQRNAYINAVYQGRQDLGIRQHGGPVRAGHPYLVGEKGPEVMVPGMNGTVVPNSNGHGTPVGGAMNVTINMPPGADGRDVVAKIKQYERVNGTSWRQ